MASANFPVAVGGDGSTVTDDSNPATGLANGGHRTRFVPALAQIVAIAQYVAAAAGAVPNAIWAPCRFMTVANDALSGLAARNGITPVAGDRVLVPAQTTASQNGIYIAAAGAWTRAPDADVAADFLAGKSVALQAGTVGAGECLFLSTTGTITLGTTSLVFLPLPSLTEANTWSAIQTHTAAISMSGAPFNESLGANIASAATINLDTATGNTVDVTGTTTITAITLAAGRRRTVRFAGALTLTHGASLILPGAANITTAAGDVAEFIGYASGVVRCVRYMEVAGRAVLSNGDTMTGPLAMSNAAINEAQGANIASAATINLDTATGNLVDVTGTTTITAITLSQGRERTVRFTGALTLTNGASLILPGAANITTADGDFAIFRGYASGVVRCINYTRANARPGNGPVVIAAGAINTAGDTTISIPAGNFKKLALNVLGIRSATDYTIYARINNDTAANYAYVGAVCDTVSGTPSNTGQAGISAIPLSYPLQFIDDNTSSPNNTFDAVIEIMNCASAAPRKGVFVRNSTMQINAAPSTYQATPISGSWTSTAAITSLQVLLRNATGNSPAGSVVNASSGDWFLTGELGVL